MHDQSLPENYSIGFTNMVERTTPGSKDLSRSLKNPPKKLCTMVRLTAVQSGTLMMFFCCDVVSVRRSAKEGDSCLTSCRNTSR